MSAEFQFDGLAELREALQKLPEDLTAEASHIIEARGNRAVLQIRSGYPPGSDLQDDTTVTFERERFGASATVSNKSKLAFIYEGGSQARHYITVRGHRHVTGRMPAKHVFVPVMLRERRAMYGDLAELLKRKGLEVSGDAS